MRRTLQATIRRFAIALVIAMTTAVVSAQDTGHDPLPPVAPKSENECYAYSREWQKRISQLQSAHEACSSEVYRSCDRLTLHESNQCFQREHNPAWDTDNNRFSLYTRCQPLKDAYKLAEAKQKQSVSECRRQAEASEAANTKGRTSSGAIPNGTSSSGGGSGSGGSTTNKGKPAGPFVPPVLPGSIFGPQNRDASRGGGRTRRSTDDADDTVDSTLTRDLADDAGSLASTVGRSAAPPSGGTGASSANNAALLDAVLSATDRPAEPSKDTSAGCHMSLEEEHDLILAQQALLQRAGRIIAARSEIYDGLDSLRTELEGLNEQVSDAEGLLRLKKVIVGVKLVAWATEAPLPVTYKIAEELYTWGKLAKKIYDGEDTSFDLAKLTTSFSKEGLSTWLGWAETVKNEEDFRAVKREVASVARLFRNEATVMRQKLDESRAQLDAIDRDLAQLRTTCGK